MRVVVERAVVGRDPEGRRRRAALAADHHAAPLALVRCSDQCPGRRRLSLDPMVVHDLQRSAVGTERNQLTVPAVISETAAVHTTATTTMVLKAAASQVV